MPKAKVYTRKEIQARWKENNPDFYADWHLKRKYGISITQYREMSAKQNHVCAICFRPETVKNRSLCVDHCHQTGLIRQLLCQGCNTSLGKLEEDITRLENMIKYIKRHRADDITQEDSKDDD